MNSKNQDSQPFQYIHLQVTFHDLTDFGNVYEHLPQPKQRNQRTCSFLHTLCCPDLVGVFLFLLGLLTLDCGLSKSSVDESGTGLGVRLNFGVPDTERRILLAGFLTLTWDFVGSTASRSGFDDSYQKEVKIHNIKALQPF